MKDHLTGHKAVAGQRDTALRQNLAVEASQDQSALVRSLGKAHGDRLGRRKGGRGQ